MAVDQPPPSVETVVVQPARLPLSAGEQAFSAVQLPITTLTATPHLDDALTDVPGVALFRRTSSLGANPTTQGMSLRGIVGSGAGRALVTLDGVPQNDPFGGWVIWTGLPSLTIDNARVVRGAGAGPYGAGALTGTVDLSETTRIPGGVAADVEGGSLGYYHAGAALDGGATSAVRVLASAAGEHSDGWIPVEAARRGAADVPLALDDWNASLRILADVGPGVLSVRAADFVEKRSAGLLFANSKAKGGNYSITYAAAPAGNRLGYRVQAWVSTSDLANTSTSVTNNRNTATPANNEYYTPSTGYGFNAAIRQSASGYSWEVGADVRAAKGHAYELFRYIAPDFAMNRVSGGQSFVGGVYAEGSRTVDNWLLTADVRVDRWASYNGSQIEKVRSTGVVTLDNETPDRDGVVPTARLGVRRNLDGGVYLRTAAYAGFRPATLNELYRPFRVGNDVTLANSALEPERLYGVEGGLGWASRTASLNATVFYNQVNNAIANVTIGKGPGVFPIAGTIVAGGTLFQRQNIGSIDAYGVEADAQVRLTPALSLTANADYTHAEVEGGTTAPQLTGLRPAEAPRFSALVGLSWRAAEPLTLAANLHYEGARFDDDQNTRPIAASTTLDVRADWKVTRAVGFFVQALNLFDEDIQTAAAADGTRSFGPPRLFRVGLVIRQ
jgi:outer membrane receptor protein involved in Fe transport